MKDSPVDELRDLDEHLDEPDCDSASETLELPDDERRAADEQEDAAGEDAVPAEERQAILQESLEDDEPHAASPAHRVARRAERGASPRQFAKPGGGWGGAEAPIRRAILYGTKRGLHVTSTKRSWGNTTSDHHVSQKRSFAVDLSNGQRPTREMDRVAAILGTLLGSPGWKGGVLTRQIGRCRFQLLYRTQVGGNHDNHVHLGCRIV